MPTELTDFFEDKQRLEQMDQLLSLANDYVRECETTMRDAIVERLGKVADATGGQWVRKDGTFRDGSRLLGIAPAWHSAPEDFWLHFGWDPNKSFFGSDGVWVGVASDHADANIAALLRSNLRAVFDGDGVTEEDYYPIWCRPRHWPVVNCDQKWLCVDEIRRLIVARKDAVNWIEGKIRAAATILYENVERNPERP